MKYSNQNIKLKISFSNEHPEALYEIYKNCFDRENEKIGSSWSSDTFYKEVSSSMVVTAELNEAVLGFVLLKDLVDMVWEISWLGVAPAHQRNGIMFNLIEFIKSKKLDRKLWLEVHENNLSALGLYKKADFQVIGERLNYYGSGQTALLMECT